MYKLKAQNSQIDSLKTLLLASKPDTHRLHLLNELSKAYFKISSDTIRFFALREKQLAQNLKQIYWQASAENNLGISCFFEASYTRALQHYRRALQLYQSIRSERGISSVYNNLGNIERALGNYPKALDYYQRGLAIQEKIQDLGLLGVSYNNIGIIFKRQGEYNKAITYYLKSLQIRKKLQDYKGVVSCYTNLGVVYNKLKQYTKGLFYCKKSLHLAQRLKLNRALYYNNVGYAFFKLNQSDSALMYIQQGYAIAEKNQDKLGKIRAYLHLAWVYYAQKAYEKTIFVAKQALTIAQQLNRRDEISQLSHVLFQSHQQLAHYQLALKYHLLHTQSKDSLINDSKTKEITRLELSYVFDKKQAFLKMQQQVKEQKIRMDSEKKLVQERWYLFSALAGLFVLAIISTFVFRSRQIQKHLNSQLVKQKDKLVMLNEELLQTQDEITAQHNHIEQQHKALVEYKYNTEGSVRAARNIQLALLPFEKDLTKVFKKHFVVYRPKNIVSGDFYWIKTINEQRLIVVADCVGHGIPGAFMSLIGINLLDKIIFQEGLTDPAGVFERLHQEINQVLQQYIDAKWSMGMDAVLCSLVEQNDGNTRLVFSGAKNPLYYVLPGTTALEVIQGDRKSIGGTRGANKSFINKEMVFPPGTLLYAGSDGLQDQNNIARQTFGTRRLQAVLKSCASLPFAQQKQRIEHCIDEYMQGTTQRDDILWVGIEL
ncbi:serine/threonine protein kinases, putative [Microscilla marina ATCC 23134]|uniref:Serine/threonine protein kinases, putative n=1 Tax=Microscilla marina ATCC 23134 TaxID=313606 RepID=A1ZIX9_MICM2|nr:serine/threonine protein kinases, putative [Microscilla marina ATCC 23134]